MAVISASLKLGIDAPLVVMIRRLRRINANVG
jgi:hypothetical protein